jgi:membrane protease YdiL (CAAX protease family)
MMMETENRRAMNEKIGLFLLIAFMGVGMVLGTTVTLLLWKIKGGQGLADMQIALSNPAQIGFIRLTQTILAACTFFLPSLVAAKVVNRNALSYIGFKSKLNIQTILWGCFLMGITIVLSGSLASLNDLIPLTESLKIYAKSLEDSYMKQIELMSVMNGMGDLIFALVVMAFAPAVFEEVFFRGGFQNMMFRATGKMWASILITSLLFSAIHFSFFGFLSRVALSIVLGLLYAYTKSIWMSIIAHFLNNAMGVFQIYYLRLKGMSIAASQDDKYPIWWSVVAVIALVYFFKYFKRAADGIRS